MRDLKLYSEPCFFYCIQIPAQCRRLMKKSGKLECHVVNWNIAINSLPTIPISLAIVALYEKIYDGESSLSVFSCYLGGCTEQYEHERVSTKCMMWNLSRPDTIGPYSDTITDYKWQGSLNSSRRLTGWGLHRFVWNLSVNSLKSFLSNATTFNPLIFS